MSLDYQNRLNLAVFVRWIVKKASEVKRETLKTCWRKGGLFELQKNETIVEIRNSDDDEDKERGGERENEDSLGFFDHFVSITP